MQNAVGEAHKKIETLHQAILAARQRVKDVVSAIEVANQNSEASQASIRDVDEALNLADRTGTQIGQYPDDAMRSVGELDQHLLNLLGGPPSDDKLL